MATRFLNGRADGRLLGYLVLGLLAAVPLALLAFGPLQGEFDETDVRGPGGIALAFAAGVLSFVSPCVLPLVPVFITHLSGASIVDGRVAADRRVTFTHALAFVTGLSAVFIVLGSAAGLLGSFVIEDHQRELEQLAGVVLMVMGVLVIPAHGRRSPFKSAILLLCLLAAFVFVVDLAEIRDERGRMALLGACFLFSWLKFAGYIQLGFFQRTFEVNTSRVRTAGYARSAVVGGAWGLGWTPCIGPVLGAILTLAATSGDALLGLTLLVAYSAGFAVPFLVTALLLSDANRFLAKIKPFAPAIEVVSGVMLIAVGVLLLSGRLTGLNGYFDFADFNEGL